MFSVKLSILDQSPVSVGATPKQALEATIELAELADELGYIRYWTAEHHDMEGLASPAPDLMLGMIGQRTKRIRIGSGAVLLPNYRPYNIAERYNLLATLFPGRVDLGIGRAPGGTAEVSMALTDNFLKQVREMPDKLDELLHFLKNDFPEENMFSRISASPVPEEPPIPWLLGTSEKSAQLAAEKGLDYVFGDFMSKADGPEILQSYRDQFQQKHPDKQPNTIVTVYAICAETTEEAKEIAASSHLWKIKHDKLHVDKRVPTIGEAKEYMYSDKELASIARLKNKQLVGNPKEVKAQLEEIQAAYETDEIMIVTITHSYEARKKSYQLLAEECGL